MFVQAIADSTIHRPVGAKVRIEVSDDGPGVPMSHRARLFERFYRVDPGRSRAQGGTGLGLAIVKHLVTSMGGEVGMESSQPGGALFWFELPCAGEADALSAPLEERGSRHAGKL